MTKKKIISILASALMLGAIAAPASQAQSAGGGNVSFQGIADLPTFPCDPGPCTGTFDGTATGAATGVDNGSHWTVAFPNATFGATFSYREPVATCPVSGTASGNFTISGGTGTYGGVSGAASATGTFTWNRTGTAADITASVKIKIGAKEFTVKGRAAATFAPLGVVHCDAPGPLQAAVVGTLTVDPTP